ncbi:KpsF/GutQ family sugar-phosphate isomerase [Novosphingobium sp.]|uniref:KpsF/GutQ family sugar-phosphate isomerase n=1 Tax=Novosphingobium sp. TaxID=1874826 RepID=UPI0026050C92|nr:KpsF/GutQ family sugar-phosphate isomerase [Novosphingobium sp.]
MDQVEVATALAASSVIARGKEVILTEARGLGLLADALDDAFVAACQTIIALRRQLVVTGMGKSGHIARKVAATFAATGTPAVYVHPGEAGHGDMGMLAPGDVLLVLSNSGNTPELRAVLAYARKIGLPVIGVASRSGSLVLEAADIKLQTPKVREACSVNIAPTTSTAVQLALGDALAMTVMDMRGVSRSDLGALHPGGAIGTAVAPVRDLMHGPSRLPLVSGDAAMPQAISVMTNGCFGLLGVIDSMGRLAGVITDGDLRRHFEDLGTACAADVMTPNPKVLPQDMLASDALQFLNDHKITAAFVVADAASGLQSPLGIIHIHDLLRQGLG